MQAREKLFLAIPRRSGAMRFGYRSISKRDLERTRE
jgi:hypothetical protein